MAKVSIVIPTKNRLELLKKTLQSVFNQSYKHTEIIVIDDGSIDGTIEYCLSEPKIEFVRNESGISGPSKARNIGMKLSSGDYILFLDDDDLLHPDHIKDVIVESEKLNSYQAISSPWRIFSEEHGKFLFDTIRNFKGEKTFEKSVHDMINPAEQDNIINSSILWRSDQIKDLQWNESLFTNGDLDFYLQALQKGIRFYGVSCGMVYYRSHSAKRVAGKTSLKGILSSTKHRLMWSEKLEKFREGKLISIAFRNSFMSLILNWMEYPERDKYIPEIKSRFLQWGGGNYYLPHMPKSFTKRLMIKFLFFLFGFQGIKIINKLKKNSNGANFLFEHSITDEKILNNIDIVS